jgi:hypothetical protein
MDAFKDVFIKVPYKIKGHARVQFPPPPPIPRKPAEPERVAGFFMSLKQ